MSLQSVVTVEYVIGGTAYELLAVGGWFAEPFKIASEQELFEPEAGIDAADAWFQPLGGAGATITFATEEEFPDHPSALAAFESPDRIDGVSMFAATGTLRVTCGDTVAEWEKAVLQSVKPDLPPYEVSTLVRAFAFTAPAVPSLS